MLNACTHDCSFSAFVCQNAKGSLLKTPALSSSCPGRGHKGRPRVRQVPEGSGEQGKMEKTGCEITCGAPTTLAVKG